MCGFILVLQVSGPVTVELNVNMHCEACAEQLKSKILKMRGTQLTNFNKTETILKLVYRPIYLLKMSRTACHAALITTS